MLKVNIELHPYGNSEKAKTISSFYIANDGTGDSVTGNYLFRKTPKDKWEPSVQDWPRRNGVELLVRAVIGNHYAE